MPGPCTVTTVAGALSWLLDLWLMFKGPGCYPPSWFNWACSHSLVVFTETVTWFMSTVLC